LELELECSVVAGSPASQLLHVPKDQMAGVHAVKTVCGSRIFFKGDDVIQKCWNGQIGTTLPKELNISALNPVSSNH